MEEDPLRLGPVPPAPALPEQNPGRVLILRIGPRPEHLTRSAIDALGDEKRRLDAKPDPKDAP